MAEDKRTLIYEAALSLVYENSDLSSIKVADIAARANIGKGTVYEYFESKEQVIGEALIYMAKKSIDSIESLLEAVKSFREAYLQLLAYFDSMLSQNRNVYDLITMNPNNLAVHTAIQRIVAVRLEEIRGEFLEMMEKLVVRSVEEVLPAMPAKFDWQTAVLSSLTCVFFHRQFEEEFALTDEEVLDKAYDAYVKLLS